MRNQMPATAITHVMEPVLPGAYAVLTVGGAGDATRLFAFRIKNHASPAPGSAAPKTIGKPRALAVAQRTGEVFTVDAPRGPYGLLALQTTERFDAATAWIANRPRIDWSDYSAAECGRPFRLLGRNFVAANRYPPVDPRNPRSYGGLLKGKTKCVARLAGGKHNRFLAIPVIQSSAYEARLALPKKLKPGAYDFFLHNGLGGNLGWSEPFRVAVAKSDPWPQDVFKVDDYLAKTRSVDGAIAAALQAAKRNRGGIVEFAAKIYPITRTIVVPRRTVLRGAGMERTMIRLPTGEGPKPPYVAVAGDGDFIVEDLRIQAVHCPVLICAPRVTAATWQAGLDAVERFGDRRARQVTVRRCQLMTHILGGRMRRKDHEQLNRVTDFMLIGRQSLGGYYAILIRGSDLTIRDNVILGGGNCIGLKHGEHAVISGNRLAVGSGGTGIFCDGKLAWPKNFPRGGGAKIIGRYSRELLIEDNEVKGASEFTRNLVMIYAGSENIHLARNEIHDIPPTTDGESFLTHLWPARWLKPRIRMTGPTAGQIIDPAGEVTRECLEGAFIDVVDGRGIGQLRRVIERNGDRFKIERPWKFDPDETSRVVFTAPPPFRNMTLVDNRFSESPINIILYGYTHDVVIDGNQVANGPGITLWPMRIEAEQKVWGGLAYTSIINNRTERDWTTVAGSEEATLPFGITVIASNYRGAPDGYDILGLVVRNNRLANNSGLRLKVTFPSGVAGVPWRIHDYGMVVERNHYADSYLGMAIEKGARVVLRKNTSRNVMQPLKWVEPREWQDQII